MNDILRHKTSLLTGGFVVYVATCPSDGLVNGRLLQRVKKQFPQVTDLMQLRLSVITKWEKEEGLLTAKVKAGHRFISSTERYQGSKLEELRQELQQKHPLEKLP